MNDNLGRLLSLGVSVLSSFTFLAGQASAQAEISNSGWSVDCLSPRFCEMKYEIRQGDAVAATFSVVHVRGQMFLQYEIPLGIDLTRGVTIGIDAEPPVETELLNCTGFGCVGTAPMTSKLVDDMKRGSSLQLVFSNPNSRDVLAIPVSLAGTAAAFQELSSR